METNNTTPLWRKLNEERTKGVAKVEYRTFDEIDLHFGNDKVGVLYSSSEYTEKESEANAAFIALAANEFAGLAGMLEKIYNIENGAFGLKSFDVDRFKKDIETVLKRIS